jgi:hypothetical protein
VSTPDIVEAHLRADRNLDAETAAALGRMFRLAYERFTQLTDAAHEQSVDAPSARDHTHAARRLSTHEGKQDDEQNAAAGDAATSA